MDIRITPTKLKGTMAIPPSKSYSHRGLIAAYLGGGEAVGVGESADIRATRECLEAIKNKKPLYANESGSTLRFMIPVALALNGEVEISGSERLMERPLDDYFNIFAEKGIEYRLENNTLYARGRLAGGDYCIRGDVSSQFITGLLFALPLLDGDSSLKLTTKLESAGYVDLTLDVLRAFGIKVDRSVSDDGFEVYNIAGNQKYIEPDGLAVEGDWSNGSFWLVCGALGGSVTVRGLDMNSSQRDKEIINVLKAMGADVIIGDGITVTAPAGLKGVEVSVAQTPDMVPVLAAAMALADGSSLITDAERLKIKESDRLRTVYDFLSRLGSDITYGGSGLSLTGKAKLAGGEVESHNDHRIAMAAAVASCGCKNAVIINGAEAVRKSYPNFFDDFAALGGKVKEI